MNDQYNLNCILQYIFDHEEEDFNENPSDTHVYYHALVVYYGKDKAYLMLEEQLKTKETKCPSCKSDNISNEDEADNGVLHVSCHDCSYQWTEDYNLEQFFEGNEE